MELSSTIVINERKFIVKTKIERNYDMDTRKTRITKAVSYACLDFPQLQGEAGAKVENVLSQVHEYLSGAALETEITKRKAGVEKAKKNNDFYKPQIGQTFAKEQQLGLSRKRVSDLEQQMKQELATLESQQEQEPVEAVDIDSSIQQEQTEAIRYRDQELLRQVNARFNDELQQQIDGTLPKGHVYELGMPSRALLSAGIRELPIELPAGRLEMKSSRDYKSDHPFELEKVRNLPEALANPIAVFESETDPDRDVILTELRSNKGEHFIAVLGISKNANRNLINAVISLYPKNSGIRVGKWFDSRNQKEIGRDLIKWVDKEKASRWLSDQSSNVTIAGLSPKRIANIIQNFENPSDGEKNSYSTQQGELAKNMRFREQERVTLTEGISDELKNTAQDFYERKSQKLVFRLQQAYQDSMLSLKKLQQAIEKESGSELEDYENAYVAENQMSSKSTFESEFYGDNFFKPMIRAVSALVEGHSYRDVLDYLIAKSGLERNEKFAMRDAERVMDKKMEKLNGLLKAGSLSKEDFAAQTERMEQQKLEDYKVNRLRDYSGLTQLTRDIICEQGLPDDTYEDYSTTKRL